MAADPRRGGRRLSIGFMVVWLVFWTAGILIVLWGVGGAALSGDLQAGAVMGIWLLAASFGLIAGARQLRRLLLDRKPPPRPAPNHRWEDGFPDEADPPPPPIDPEDTRRR